MLKLQKLCSDIYIWLCFEALVKAFVIVKLDILPSLTWRNKYVRSLIMVVKQANVVMWLVFSLFFFYVTRTGQKDSLWQPIEMLVNPLSWSSIHLQGMLLFWEKKGKKDEKGKEKKTQKSKKKVEKPKPVILKPKPIPKRPKINVIE